MRELDLGEARERQRVLREAPRRVAQHLPCFGQLESGLQCVGERDPGRRRVRLELDRAARIGERFLRLVPHDADDRALSERRP